MNGIHLYESKHTEGYNIRVHFHHHYQLLYVIDGEGSILLEGETHHISEHSTMVIFPYSKHAVSSTTRMTLLVLSFDEGMLEGMFTPLNKEDIGFTGSFCCKLPHLQANEMKLLLRKLLFEERQQGMFHDWAMRTHLSEILLGLCRVQQSDCMQDANSLRAEKIRNYIEKHYYESLTAEQLAQKFGVSARYSNTIFKERYKQTPIQYLNEIRHSLAKKLLAETDMNIVSLCFEVGYESLPTFYRSFKQLAQMSPTVFRQMNQREP
ncbi:AraC family transcriptional regulator [Paenibacillus sp. Soil766]|uniref:helix-turn-helix transcriptional regulator n=1 Tax=Paenibacillus sp. Soil766 TaxID=1736404 RepID=UPI00070FC524|nr:AraC family transcriptional regulator [Paenibacillus sp. Soil766]KRF06563.1 AraC family transcriptional regulator [Paenibacillus sp. Soil766]